MRILEVGQCGFDGPRMEALWRDRLGAEVDSVDFPEDAIAQLKSHKYDIALVNRILAVDGSSGLHVVESLVKLKTKTPIMLVSDRSDAQDEAVRLGACRGFGKSELGDESTLDLIRDVCARGDRGK
jgi:ActR/RegA family two-component response regulator